MAVLRNDHILTFSEVFEILFTSSNSLNLSCAVLTLLTLCCTWQTIPKAHATLTNSNAYVSVQRLLKYLREVYTTNKYTYYFYNTVWIHQINIIYTHSVGLFLTTLQSTQQKVIAPQGLHVYYNVFQVWKLSHYESGCMNSHDLHLNFSLVLKAVHHHPLNALRWDMHSSVTMGSSMMVHAWNSHMLKKRQLWRVC